MGASCQAAGVARAGFTHRSRARVVRSRDSSAILETYADVLDEFDEFDPDVAIVA